MKEFDWDNRIEPMKRYDVDEMMGNLARLTASLAMTFCEGKGTVSADGKEFILDPESELHKGNKMVSDGLIHSLREKVEAYHKAPTGQGDPEKIEGGDGDEA